MSAVRPVKGWTSSIRPPQKTHSIILTVNRIGLVFNRLPKKTIPSAAKLKYARKCPALSAKSQGNKDSGGRGIREKTAIKRAVNGKSSEMANSFLCIVTYSRMMPGNVNTTLRNLLLPADGFIRPKAGRVCMTETDPSHCFWEAGYTLPVGFYLSTPGVVSAPLQAKNKERSMFP